MDRHKSFRTHQDYCEGLTAEDGEDRRVAENWRFPPRTRPTQRFKTGFQIFQTHIAIPRPW